MLKTVCRFVGFVSRLLGLGILSALAITAIVAFRHLLDTPQPLESRLPGTSNIYRWKRGHIFYKVLGAVDAPPLLLLHTPELGGSGYEMRKIMGPLAQYFRVYTPDLLGFGLSDHPAIDYSAETYIALCRDFLKEVVREPAAIVASRTSCNYAVKVAATAPELCERLALISPAALYREDETPGFPRVPTRGTLDYPRVPTRGTPTMRRLLLVPLVKSLLYPLLSTRVALSYVMARQRPLTSDDDLDYFYATTHQLGAEHAPMALLAGKLTYSAFAEIATRCADEQLQQPTLIIWGAQSDQSVVATILRWSELGKEKEEAQPEYLSGDEQVEEANN